jgi:TPR repeat protein
LSGSRSDGRRGGGAVRVARGPARLRLLAALVALALPAAAQAGFCRAAVRPLLLSTTPDAEALGNARRTCAAEAEAGNADSLYHLALFSLGLGGEWRPDAAVPMVREAAGAGVPEAQYWLAWQLESGDLLPRDEAAALGWYQRAAAANHRLAIGRLARAYRAGELGLPRDPLLALEYEARQAQCLRHVTANVD